VSARRSVPLYTPCAASAPHSDRRRAIGGPRAWASSIFGAVHFDRWVVTHSIAGSNLHGHRPILQSKRRPSEGSVDERTARRTPHARFRFSPHRQYCLPVVAHLGPQRVASSRRFFVFSPKCPSSFALANTLLLSRRRFEQLPHHPLPFLRSGSGARKKNRKKDTEGGEEG